MNDRAFITASTDKALSLQARHHFLVASGIENQNVAGARFDRHGLRLVQTLSELYGSYSTFEPWLFSLCAALGALMAARPDSLRKLDHERERAPDWFIDAKLVGYCAYADRFGGNLQGVTERVPYLEQMGVGYLHLLPFLRARQGDSDGGFAVADFSEVEPALGNINDLERLTERLRQSRISLCADLVLNHVADQHAWATAAMQGDERYRSYFHIFPDRTLPDHYEQTVAQIFPQTAPGNFTHVEALNGWVWTTFYPYQWDLNYTHPPVFASIAMALLQLANHGVEIFRLDSAPFLWKRLQTSCVNQPEVHTILAALRAITDLVAPAVLLKAEAIVPVAALVPYFGAGAMHGHECHLAYHSGLMAASWVSLTEARTDLLQRLLKQATALPTHTGWMTYVRCHDDIVWGVLRDDVEAISEDFNQRVGAAAAFLEGRVTGSFGRGVAFQSADGNALHGTNGMTSSLLGLDRDGDILALRRLALMYGLAFLVGTVPLLYMGDELAQPNNQAQDDATLIARDSRWVQRPRIDEHYLAKIHDHTTYTGQAYAVIESLVTARRHAAFDPRAAVHVIDDEEAPLLILRRGERLIAVFNFSGSDQPIPWQRLPAPHTWATLLKTSDGASDEAPDALSPWSMIWLIKPSD